MKNASAAAIAASFLILNCSAAFGGEWQFDESTSPVDDSKIISLVLQSKEPFKDRFGNDELGSLVLKCQNHKTLFAIWAGGEVMGGKDYDTIIRFDKLPAQTYSFDTSTDYKALVVSGMTAASIIQKIETARTMFARVVLFGGEQLDLRFDLSGFKSMLSKVTPFCDW